MKNKILNRKVGFCSEVHIAKRVAPVTVFMLLENTLEAVLKQ